MYGVSHTKRKTSNIWRIIVNKKSEKTSSLNRDRIVVALEIKINLSQQFF